MFRSSSGLALVAVLAVSGCNQKPTPAPTPVAAAPAATQPKPGDEVRDALAAHNFGEATLLAGKAADAAPNDPALRLLQAEAEGQLGNGGNAARALDRAAAAGLADPAGAARDPMFDPVRDDPSFRSLVDRLNRPQAASAGGTTHRPTSTIRAGDVEVRGDSVRAGDLVLEGNH
jgi:hypothetical protein